ncbi:Clavaminate synthase-like protein [Mytilinidion resinicola]|uniref:Clavaminate synthase-like protein n=1 Tax=Mytilinidion resinicola TaxID=574789 RepID=A0A6A6YZ42_9PEZI|nr:Clavaminate synthase-like protein [Mytilinidion resinicola]KAF2814020.1 Clavaminate synthase-like protein [Mytilinidion resinicola]
MVGVLSTSQAFTSFTFSGQKSTKALGFPNDAEFPLALKPAANWQPTLQESVTAIEGLAKSGQISSLAQKHGGAIIFRGLPIKTPQDYSEVAHAFGFRAHEEVGRPPLRTVLAKNIKTANEGPPELPIWPHNEYGWSTINPAWLTFSAIVIPEQGNIALASALEKQAPEFVRTLLKKGVRYVYRYGVQEVKSNTGTSVLGAYGQTVVPGDDAETVRRKVEAEVQRHSERFEWHEDGSLSVMHIVPIIRKHEKLGLTTFFGNLTSAWGRSKHYRATEPPYLGSDGSYHPIPEYGDGTPIETKYLDLALAIAEDSQVLLTWQPGDVVLIDNHAVQHSRSPWVGNRTVLAALWDEDGKIGDFEEGIEILESSPRVPIVV